MPYKCPAASLLREGVEMRRQACAEWRAIEKHVLFAHYNRDTRPPAARCEEYVARRLAELRRWNPGRVIVGGAT